MVRVPFNFANGAEGFTADFGDYAAFRDVGQIRFVSELRNLPAPLADRRGLFLGGTNRDDALIMYIWRPVTGLVPGQRYRVGVDFLFATNVAPGCVGVGGSPGESVYLKAGAAEREPAKVVVDNFVDPSFDQGSASQSGADIVTVGTYEGGGGDCSIEGGVYRTKRLSTIAAAPVPGVLLPQAPVRTADASGRLWIVIATDSAFEDRTEIYYLEGEAVFTAV